MTAGMWYLVIIIFVLTAVMLYVTHLISLNTYKKQHNN